VSGTIATIADSFFRPALADVAPYEPGKPVEEVQRELGLDRVVKLASNEGPYGPFPDALEAIARAVGDLNRYPDGGCFRLRQALADKHGVALEEVVVGGGADAIVDCLSQATLDPGDEIVCGWPSFPSYVIYALKLGAVARQVPLRDHRYDLESMLEAIGPRTKLAYLCHPNNPTGTVNTRRELDSWFRQVPDHVLTVVDQAYFEYVDDPDYPDAIAEYVREGGRAVVTRTFSKIYGLAGLRVGYGVAPAAVITAIGKTRRAFDVTTIGQEAALVSLSGAAEIERRRRLNAEGRAELERIFRKHDLHPVPSAANFVFVDVGSDSRSLFEQLLGCGVIVRPLHGFGAPNGIRVTVGTPEDHALLDESLSAVENRAGTR
jgi:histidinol-phosphate aminotransferase